MNKYLYHVIATVLLCTAGSLSSCQLADDAQSEDAAVGTIPSLTLSTVMPAGFKTGITYAGQTVTLKSDRMSYTAKTDDTGRAVFNNLVPDIYSIATSWKLSAAEYAAMASSDEVENRPVLVSSSVASQRLFDAQEVTLTLNKMVEQTLLISKIYASGTKDNNDKNYLSDRFIEIFNNSDEVQYVDQLYLALTEAVSPAVYPAASNKGYVYVRQIFQFPGKGADYPVEPGKSVVVCNSAINHLEESSTSADLSTADFEVKNTRYSNNAKVPEMPLVFTSFSTLIYMNLVNGGDNGVLLLQTDSASMAKYPRVYAPGKTKGELFVQIPDGTILDGVETLKNKTTGVDVNTKRIPTFIDASYGFINATSGYTHESIERRVDVSRSTAERIYLIDTNNTLSDFRTVTDVTPRHYAKTLLISE